MWNGNKVRISLAVFAVLFLFTLISCSKNDTTAVENDSNINFFLEKNFHENEIAFWNAFLSKWQNNKFSEILFLRGLRQDCIECSNIGWIVGLLGFK